MNKYTQKMIKRVTEQSKLDDVKYAKEDEAKANLEAQKEAKNGNLLETQKIFRGVKDVRSSDDYQTICNIVKNATGTRKEIAQQLYTKGYCRIVKGKIAPLSTLTIKAL